MQQGIFFSILVLLCNIPFFLVQARISVIWRTSAEKEQKTESGIPRIYYLPWKRKGKDNFDGLLQERSGRRRSQKHS